MSSPIEVRKNVLYIQGSYGEPPPKYARVRFRYTKQRNADMLSCWLMVRGTTVAERRTVDVSGQPLYSTQEYTVDMEITTPPPVYDVQFTMSQPLTDVESIVSLDLTKALIVIVVGSPSGYLSVEEYYTGNLLEMVQPVDLDASGTGGAYVVIIPRGAVTLRLKPCDVRYSFYIVPREVIDNARVTVTMECEELRQTGGGAYETIGVVFGSLLSISARTVASPELVIELVGWDASG